MLSSVSGSGPYSFSVPILEKVAARWVSWFPAILLMTLFALSIPGFRHQRRNSSDIFTSQSGVQPGGESDNDGIPRCLLPSLILAVLDSGDAISSVWASSCTAFSIWYTLQQLCIVVEEQMLQVTIDMLIKLDALSNGAWCIFVCCLCCTGPGKWSMLLTRAI